MAKTAGKKGEAALPARRSLTDSRTLLATAMLRRGLSVERLAEKVRSHGIGASSVRRAAMAKHRPRQITAEAIAAVITTPQMPITAWDIMFDCGYKPAMDEPDEQEAYEAWKTKVEQFVQKAAA